ncbi:helix-turn-helix domain-containing protein [Streptomyces sp. HUAS TT7]|uniref:helix-turn-helix domain-containing protein n=1 Tax=Streptomyces sp. HUAS TT7 TaxID=3447507 RepID=UPI003F65812A
MTTPEPKTPTVNRRQLGAELRRLRTLKNLTIEDVAAHLGTSSTRMSRMETGKGRVVPKPQEIEALCELYGVQDERQVQMLIGMLSDSRQPGWWDQYREVLPSGLEVYFGLETDALAERAWETVLVHGLLQTPDYAREIIRASPSTPAADIDDMVAVRTKRQELLTRSSGRSPLEFWAILDEAAIRRPVGGAEVMRAQLLHLIEAQAWPNVTLQIVPASKGAHPGLGGAFSMLEFEAEPPVVYIDSPAGNLYLEKKADVRKFTSTFDLLRAMALDPEETVAFLRDAAKET